MRIETSSNLEIVNFLDVIFNLDKSFKTFNKNNHIPTYVNINLNHPKSIIKQIPNTVNLGINRLSSFKNIFENNKKFYNETSSFHQKLEYLDINEINTYEYNNRIHNNYRMNDMCNNHNHIRNNTYKNRQRKMIWFNPPFYKLSNINIRKYFLN